MRFGGIVVVLWVVCGACSKANTPVVSPPVVASPAPVPEPPPAPVSVLDRLPGPAGVVVGMHRVGSAEELVGYYQKMAAAGPASTMPPCALDVVGRLEEAAVALDPASRALRFGVRGDGLHAAVDTCLRTLVPGTTIAAEGAVTHYQIGTDEFYVLWLGDSMGIGAADTGAASVAEFAETPTPLSHDDRIRPLLDHIDPAATFWFVADAARLGDRSGLPVAPESAWATIDAQAFRVTVVLSSGQDAAKLAAMIRDGASKVPPPIKAMLEHMTVDVDGAKTVVVLPYLKLMRLANVDPATVPPVVAPYFAAGVVAGIGVPAFQKNAKRAKTVEALILVKKMSDGGRVAYARKHTLPKSAGPTPPLGTCCAGKDQRCPVDPALWATASWKALQFDVTDPYRYSYAFKSDKASFTATAYGDLNCDGIYSTFEMKGTIGRDGKITTDDITKDHELE